MYEIDYRTLVDHICHGHASRAFFSPSELELLLSSWAVVRLKHTSQRFSPLAEALNVAARVASNFWEIEWIRKIGVGMGFGFVHMPLAHTFKAFRRVRRMSAVAVAV